ncbi:MAG: glycoside hydrolase family 92 protein, partial [Ferruginibacter sp.]
VEMGDQSGKHYLERWELLNAYSGCMIGNPAIPVIADAYVKGIQNFNVPKAYQYALNTAEKFGNGDKGYTYQSFGISNTLEYAFAESCLADLSKALSKMDDEKIYRKRAQSYRNIFDTATGWFRPKLKDGEWEPMPAEGRLKEWYGTIECNPYQQGWFVPHDVKGMVELMGGNKKVIDDLTNLFDKTPENMMWNNYYNHANEPVHHVPFLFNRVGAPWLTQKWTRAICKRAYHNSVEGLVGNEDVGQMSAWYVLAASGFHPIAAGNLRYEITSPVFNKVIIQLDKQYASGKTFIIIAKNNSPENIYIQSATLNGKVYPYCFISHTDIVSGGVLELQMGSEPNKEWGRSE